jgi:serine/threonine-protein kinase
MLVVGDMQLPARIGRYEVELQLGEGGLGRVFLARDPVLGRQVAVRVLRDDLGLTPELEKKLVARVRQEARALALLSHPGLVTLHDMGDDEAVGLYLVFELVKGPTLRERGARGPMPAHEVAQIARALGSALAHAHRAGCVHRDIKPENVLLAPTGPKLSDLGIARLPDPIPSKEPPAGVPNAYLAPESLATGVFDAQTDQFALAATLYEALTAKRAFPGDEALTVASRVATTKHANATAVQPGLRGFAHLDAIFDRALAKDAGKRFLSCEMFGSVLAAELEGLNAALLTPSLRSSIVPRATRRWQNVLAAIAVLVILVLAILGRQRRTDPSGAFPRNAASPSAPTVGPPHAAPVSAHHANSASPSSSAAPIAAPLPQAAPWPSNAPDALF